MVFTPVLTTVPTEFKRSYACWFAKEWRQSIIDQWTVSSNWSRNQIIFKVDQGEFDPFVDIYLETVRNDLKINQNDPQRIKTKWAGNLLMYLILTF